MLDTFITAQRAEIIVRTKARVLARTGPKPAMSDGVPDFLNQLVSALELADSTDEIDHDKLRQSAGRHGDAMLRMGFTIDEVVHEYGDVCQVISDLVVEQSEAVPTVEFRVMNLCLDDAIAEAVTRFADPQEHGVDAGAEPLGKITHELRTLLATAKRSFAIIKRGQVAPAGATGDLLERSLTSIEAVIQRVSSPKVKD